MKPDLMERQMDRPTLSMMRKMEGDAHYMPFFKKWVRVYGGKVFTAPHEEGLFPLTAALESACQVLYKGEGIDEKAVDWLTLAAYFAHRYTPGRSVDTGVSVAA